MFLLLFFLFVDRVASSPPPLTGLYSYFCAATNTDLCLGVSAGDAAIATALPLVLKPRRENELSGNDLYKLRFDVSYENGTIRPSANLEYCLQNRRFSDFAIEASECDERSPRREWNNSAFLETLDQRGRLYHPHTRKCATVMTCIRRVAGNGNRYCEQYDDTIRPATGTFVPGSPVRLWPCSADLERNQLFRKRLDCAPGCSPYAIGDGVCNPQCLNANCSFDFPDCVTRSPTPPTLSPTSNPITASPSRSPTRAPSQNPSRKPSRSPSRSPSRRPSRRPSRSPSRTPSQKPSRSPSRTPSRAPSRTPSRSPSRTPSQRPSRSPSRTPSLRPSRAPSQIPTTNAPSRKPTTNAPSAKPTTTFPTRAPSTTPSARPAASPTLVPSAAPTNVSINATVIIAVAGSHFEWWIIIIVIIVVMCCFDGCGVLLIKRENAQQRRDLEDRIKIRNNEIALQKIRMSRRASSAPPTPTPPPPPPTPAAIEIERANRSAKEAIRAAAAAVRAAEEAKAAATSAEVEFKFQAMNERNASQRPLSDPASNIPPPTANAPPPPPPQPPQPSASVTANEDGRWQQERTMRDLLARSAVLRQIAERTTTGAAVDVNGDDDDEEDARL